jgi:polyisoprenoid-binding protein YceI
MTMIRKTTLIGAAAALAIAGAAVAQQLDLTSKPAEVRAGSYALDPAHGKITWSVSHMGFSTYVGQFTDVKADLRLDPANPTASRLTAEAKTGSARTLSDQLDAHLKTADFLDVARFPTATFKATGIRMTDADSAEITGNLTLRGVTKSIVIAADFNQAGTNPVDKHYTVGFDGEAKIKRSDFGINYGLPLLGDEVTLHFEAEFKLQPKAASAADQQGDA